jgi:PAS domain S-box-containing protein
VASARPRVWTADELGLIDEVAERAWVEVERTRAQAEVAESEARFRAIADTAPVLIWVTQQDRQRAFVNQAYVAYMGGDYESVRTADWRSFIHPDDQDHLVRESMAGEATGQPFSLEARYKHHTGEYRWLKSFSRPRLAPGGQVLGFVGVAFDVTDAREAQAAAGRVRGPLPHRRRQRPGPDLDDRRTPRHRLHQQTLQDLLQRRRRPDPRRPLDGLHPSRRCEGLLPDLPAAPSRPGTGSRRSCGSSTRPSASAGCAPRACRASTRPGAFQGYVGASLDITDAKRAEDDLKRINELLEERVGEALAEKAKAEADLMHAQRMEAVGRLTGGVAHDFNNLLTVVIGALDMILKSPDNAARRKKLGEAALAAARRGEGLTHQLAGLLAPSGPAARGRRPQRPDPGERAPAAPGRRRGGRVQDEAAARRGPGQRRSGPVRGRPAQSDGQRPRRRGRPQQGPDHRPDHELHGRGRRGAELAPGQYVCVTVSDNGAGMDAATMTRVFEPFFTTKAVGKGTGLGLSQVYGFARQSGGGVHIASTVGRGTEIKLYLPPLDAAETVAIPEDRTEIDAIPSGRRLLLVEDDVGVAAIAMELLTGLGLDVEAPRRARRRWSGWPPGPSTSC